MSATDSTKSSMTDWDRLADPTDEDIDYSDIPPLEKTFFEQATWRLPSDKETVTLRLDRDVLTWFRSQGKELEHRINSILRAYKEAHEPA